MNKTQLAKSFDECLALQASFNSVVNTDWRKANYAWRRAMWIEAGELCDHLGYKWWKNVSAPYDARQVLLEVVDIFHFLLSDVLVENKAGGAQLVNSYEWATKHVYAPTKEKKLQQVEEFVVLALEKHPIQAAFFQVVVALDININDLLKYYLGKNALNNFRQANGDKTGEYRRQWNYAGETVEDNVVLERILDAVDTVPSFDTIYAELTAIYGA